MEDNLIRITPDKNKAKSLLKMVETTLEMISKIDVEKFPSNVTKEYYEIIRELITDTCGSKYIFIILPIVF